MMKQKRKTVLLLIGFILLWSLQNSCKKTEPEEIKPRAGLEIFLEHQVAGQALQWDTLLYTNKAGQAYSISRLEYFLSDFKLIAGHQEYPLDAVKYVNAATSTSIQIDNLPPGSYTGISFILGVDTVHNIPNGLPPTIENNNMFWPVQMGGGYHFMKLEGYFTDSIQSNGYAMHLGRNENAVKLQFNQAIEINQEWKKAKLEMDINRWFENPHTYNFSGDGRYTMSSALLMNKLKENGWNVFQFKFLE